LFSEYPLQFFRKTVACPAPRRCAADLVA
jgi:hypothetical protein